MDIINNIINNIENFNYIWFLSTIFSLLTFETFLKILVVYFFIVWIAIIIWVTKDIINRTNNILYQIFSILTVLVLTPLWVVIYLLIRPSKTLFEKYYEEAQIEEDADLDTEENNEKEETKIEEIHHCPKCNYVVKEDYKFCPSCRAELKKECIKCWKELKSEWKTCPFCWEEQEKKVEKNKEKKEKDENIEIINDKKEEEKIDTEIKE